ncbi:MAG: SRPBCC family protein [Chloroflexota bacterium]|nr:SRPBCC family protein [Chloroflexota bacterium]
MARIAAEIDIDGRPTDVFRFCHDADRRPEWDERVTRVNVLTPKPVRRGSVIRVDAHPTTGGPVFSWEGEFVEYQYPSRSRLTVIDAAPSSYFVGGSEVWDVRRSGAGTRLTFTWDYEPRGFVGRILDPLVRRGRIRRAISESLENLKQRMEAGA